MQKYTKKAVWALLFVGTVGAMEQMDVEFIQDTDVLMEMLREHTIEQSNSAQQHIKARIRALLNGNFNLNTLIEEATILERARIFVMQKFDNGVESAKLGHSFSKAVGRDFNNLYEMVRSCYCSFIEGLVLQSASPTLLNAENRRNLQIQYSNAMNLYKKIEQLGNSFFSENDLMRIFDYLNNIARNLQ